VRIAGRLVILVALARGLDPGAASAPAVVQWNEPDGSERLRVDVRALPPPGETATPLLAPVWNPRLPEQSIPLLDGGSFDLAAARGSVVVLDFWASWCTPCRQELPHLEGLYRDLRASGLVAIAINVNEEPEVARSAARALGLTMPIGRHDDSIGPALFRQALPTILVADRFGAIRRRFDGYRVGDEREIASLVRELLAETRSPERTVARVDTGADTFRVLWARDPPTTIDGLAVSGALPSGLFVSLWRGVTLFGSDGRTVREWPSSRSRGALRGSASSTTALAFRPGSAEATLLVGGEAGPEAISVSGEILDASPFGTDRWMLATTRGIELVPAGEPGPSPLGPIVSVAQVGTGGTAGVAAATRDGRLLLLDPSLELVREAGRAEPGARVVGALAADPGYGIVPPAVRSAAVGRFLPGGRTGIALAMQDELVVLDLSTGGLTFRASWPDLLWVAAGDVDGDGVDDLAVAASRRVVVLSSARPAEGARPSMTSPSESVR
jgi:thiol-disulfide isomerase/thioredoxin